MTLYGGFLAVCHIPPFNIVTHNAHQPLALDLSGISLSGESKEDNIPLITGFEFLIQGVIPCTYLCSL